MNFPLLFIVPTGGEKKPRKCEKHSGIERILAVGIGRNPHIEKQKLNRIQTSLEKMSL